MQMDVENTLACVCIAVHDDAVTVVSNAFGDGDRRCSRIQAANDCLIVRGNIIDRRNVLARNNNDVSRRLRVDIAKRDCRFRLKDDIGGYVAA